MNAVKRIIMPLGVAGQAEQRLKGALAVAKHYQAHLDVLFTYVSPRQTIPQSIFGLSKETMDSLTQTADQHAENLASDLKKLFTKLCQEQSVSTIDDSQPNQPASAKWHHIDGLRSQICAQQGRVADLIVAARPSVPGPSSLIESVTTLTGRPVLLMPREQETFKADRIVIGWNGSAEVANAVDKSMGMLQAAKEITVLTTSERMGNSPDASELSDYLAWHGLTAELVVMDAGSASVGEALFSEAMSRAADLLVLGAYSGRQVREMFTGSVTQYVLSSANLPVLMAH